MRSTGRRSKVPMILLVLGIALLIAAPLAGLGGSLHGLVRGFKEIEASRTPTPQDLSAGLHGSMAAWTITGLLAGAAGLILTVVASLALYRQQRPGAPTDRP